MQGIREAFEFIEKDVVPGGCQYHDSAVLHLCREGFGPCDFRARDRVRRHTVSGKEGCHAGRLCFAGLSRVLRDRDADVRVLRPVRFGRVDHERPDVGRIERPPLYIEDDVLAVAQPRHKAGGRPVRVGAVRRDDRRRKVPGSRNTDNFVRDLPDDAEHIPLEVQARCGADFPVAAQQPFLFDEAQGVQRGKIARVRFQEDFIVKNARADEGRTLAEFRVHVVLCRQLVACITPVDFSVKSNKITDDARPFRDRVARVLVNPPGDEAGYPGIGIRVAGGPDVRAHAAGRAVTAHHVRKLCFREMCQFVEADERDLCALVAIHRVIAVQVVKSDLRAAREDDALGCRFQERRAQGPVNAFRIVPEAAFISNLAAVPTENDDAELRVADVPQGLEQQSVCLA